MNSKNLGVVGLLCLIALALNFQLALAHESLKSTPSDTDRWNLVNFIRTLAVK
jgi:hypothetical protein